MGFGVVDVKRFGGLQLSTDPADVGLERAIAGENFDLAIDGSFVRTRDGITRLGAAGALSGTTCFRLIPDNDAVTPKLLAISDNTSTTAYLDSVTVAGTVTAVGSWTVGAGSGYFDAVNFGTPAATMTFIATDAALMRKYTGGALATSVGKPRFLAVTPTSNRLIQAWFAAAADSPTGALGSMSTVFFSDAGAPETFSANNYVHLRPGDGEQIRGVAVYRGQVFVFKESTVFIFSGESTSSTGTPVFDFRAVNLDARVANVAGPVVAVTGRGVYYLGADGVYVTTGGPPALVSAPLSDLFQSGAVGQPYVALWATAAHLILSAVQGAAAYLYVYDERRSDWVRWSSGSWSSGSIERQPFVAWQEALLGSPESLFFALADSILYTDEAATTDAGTAIASSYQTGFSDLGAPSVKTVRQIQAWGSGAPTLSVGVDYATPDTGSTVTLGTAPAVDDAIQATSRRGTTFSVKVAAASGVWKIANVALHVRRPRSPGAKP